MHTMILVPRIAVRLSEACGKMDTSWLKFFTEPRDKPEKQVVSYSVFHSYCSVILARRRGQWTDGSDLSLTCLLRTRLAAFAKSRDVQSSCIQLSSCATHLHPGKHQTPTDLAIASPILS